MRQLLQNLKSGDTEIVEAPAPSLEGGHLLVASCLSLISIGTERMLVDFGKASYIAKARQQPEKVKQVVEKIRVDGLAATYESVNAKLNEAIPMGYSNVGIVIDVGDGINNFRIGDRVVSNGPHADLVHVPENLCAKIPDKVDDELAVFTVLGSIALQGIRLARPTTGEKFAVLGTGIIGLLTIQILRANGCQVAAFDYEPEKLALAETYGATAYNLSSIDAVAAGLEFSQHRGIDGVIITASTASSEPVENAARMSRQRGRIILVGVTGLQLNRTDFYEKELTFQVSCSYGPGRYDENYEQLGLDYPFGLVRWTEQRNFQAVLALMEDGKLNCDTIPRKEFLFDDVHEAYDALYSDRTTLCLTLRYPDHEYSNKKPSRFLKLEDQENVKAIERNRVVGVIGAGNYASRTLIPAFKERHSVRLHTLVTKGGVSSAVQGRRMGFLNASSDVNAIFDDSTIDTVVIATRHNTHAELIRRALDAGKHVFVEKPLAITHEQLDLVKQGYESSRKWSNPPQFMAGFNRRFSPHLTKARDLILKSGQRISTVVTVNAGELPPDHWTQDKSVGGGRIVGEVCHFIDALMYLSDARVKRSHISQMDAGGQHDTVTIALEFENGDLGVINYFANGSQKLPKEKIEVFCGGKNLLIDNFRSMTGYGWKGFKNMSLRKQDKGQRQCVDAFLSSILCNDDNSIFYDFYEVSKLALELRDSLIAQN